MTEVQKRRFMDCFSDIEDLDVGYSLFERDDLHTLKNHYLLHQDISFPPSWDLALTGFAYGEVLFEYGEDERRNFFEMDRVASAEQSRDVAEHVQTFVENTQVSISGSRQSGGVQAADCIAGAIAEDHKSDTDWLSEIDPGRVTDCGPLALIQLEQKLDAHGY
jgi:hypothetical protein